MLKILLDTVWENDTLKDFPVPLLTSFLLYMLFILLSFKLPVGQDQVLQIKALCSETQ